MVFVNFAGSRDNVLAVVSIAIPKKTRRWQGSVTLVHEIRSPNERSKAISVARARAHSSNDTWWSRKSSRYA